MFGEVVGVASGVCNCVCDPHIYYIQRWTRAEANIHRMILAELAGDVHEEL